MHHDRFSVFFCSVALVLGESIHRQDVVQANHVLISVNFRDDGSGGNAFMDVVPANNRLLPYLWQIQGGDGLISIY